MIFLDFEDCKFLTEIPSLSRAPNLGSLCLDYCTNLFRIHESVGFLDNLVLLSAQGCIQLESLVPCMNLPSLETLDLSGCSRLESFPEVLGVMENIEDVYLDKTNLYQLPFTIGNLVGLQRLFLRGCKRMIQLPSYILPKLEIIISYGCRGFRSSENEEKVNPKVFENAMRVYNEYGESFLNVYSHSISSNDVMEVSSPQWKGVPPSSFTFKRFQYGISQPRVNAYKFRSNESSLCFWFRKKFPRIALSCSVKPREHFDNMVWNFKFTVLINGTKQLTFSCEYIFYTHKKTDQDICCDLQCKVEGVFSDNQWNQVKILCEMEQLMPRDSKGVANQEWIWTTKRILNWYFLYVYPENEKDDYKFDDNPDSPLSTKEIVAKEHTLQECL